MGVTLRFRLHRPYRTNRRNHPQPRPFPIKGEGGKERLTGIERPGSSSPRAQTPTNPVAYNFLTVLDQTR